MVNRAFYFTANTFDKIKLSLIVTFFLVFILYFLKPYDMDTYIPANRFYLYFGYGLSLFTGHLLTIFIEDKIYRKQHFRWFVKNEILIKIFYFLAGSTLIYFYHFLVVKPFQHPWTSYPVFVVKYTLPFFLIFIPVLTFYRKSKGVIHSNLKQSFTLSGTNKNEFIHLFIENILYVRSESNYVKVYFCEEGQLKKIMLRNTLSKILKQAPFLVRTHRSYLVNPCNIKEIKGNSQNAVIHMKREDLEVPLSKTYYKEVIGLTTQNAQEDCQK